MGSDSKPGHRKNLVLALFFAAGAARGADVVSTWNASSGSWGTPSNWTNVPAVGGYPSDGNAGVATYDAVIANGGAVTLDVEAEVEQFTISNGSLAGGATNMIVNKGIRVGAGGKLRFASAAGFLLSAGPVVVDGGAVDVGVGEFDIDSEAGFASQSGLYVGVFAPATGSLVIKNGGSVSVDAPVAAGATAGASGSIQVQGAGSKLTVNEFQGFAVGNTGDGTLSVLDGGQVISFGAAVGNDAFLAPGTGAVNLAGAGSLWQDDLGIAVGFAGDGKVVISSGAKLVSGGAGMAIGREQGSNGSVIVQAGGRLDVTQPDPNQGGMAIAGSELGPGGSGLLQIDAGGTVNAASGIEVFADGILRVHGILNTPQVLVRGGRIEAEGTVTFALTSRTATLDVAAAQTLTLAGPLISDATDGPSVTTKVGAGVLTIAGTQTHAPGSTLYATDGTTNVNTDAGGSTGGARNLTFSANAAVNFNATQHLAAIMVENGGVVTLVPTPIPAERHAVVNAVALNGSGKLDLTNGLLLVDYAPGQSPFAAVRAAVLRGYGTGAMHWTGSGIVTSAAPALAGTAGLGYAEASTVLPTTAGGPVSYLGESVDASTVIVRYTLLGDADLSGRVDFNDLVKLAQNYNSPGGKVWSQGDFNYDGAVDFNDLVRLAQNYNASLAVPLTGTAGGAVPQFDEDLARAFATMPEPGAPALPIAAAIAVARRCRKKL